MRLDAGEVPGPGDIAIIVVYRVTSFTGTLDHRADPDGEIAALSWQRIEDAAALLDEHPFPFARAVYRHTVAAARSGSGAVGHCYFRRQADGDDSPVSGPFASARFGDGLGSPAGGR